MEATQKISQRLEGKTFLHKKEKFIFLRCKQVSSNIMVYTNLKMIQVPDLNVDSFLNNIVIVEDATAENTETADVSDNETTEITSHLTVVGDIEVTEPKNVSVSVLESFSMPETFSKLNKGFDLILDRLENAKDEDLADIETRAKILTSVGKTAIDLMNSKIRIREMMDGK